MKLQNCYGNGSIGQRQDGVEVDEDVLCRTKAILEIFIEDSSIVGPSGALSWLLIGRELLASDWLLGCPSNGNRGPVEKKGFAGSSHMTGTGSDVTGTGSDRKSHDRNRK